MLDLFFVPPFPISMLSAKWRSVYFLCKIKMADGRFVDFCHMLRGCILFAHIGPPRTLYGKCSRYMASSPVIQQAREIRNSCFELLFIYIDMCHILAQWWWHGQPYNCWYRDSKKPWSENWICHLRCILAPPWDQPRPQRHCHVSEFCSARVSWRNTPEPICVLCNVDQTFCVVSLYCMCCYWCVVYSSDWKY